MKKPWFLTPFRFFPDVRFKGDWEWNFVTKLINIRVGRSQIAMWVGRKYAPVINWLSI